MCLLWRIGCERKRAVRMEKQNSAKKLCNYIYWGRKLTQGQNTWQSGEGDKNPQDL